MAQFIRKLYQNIYPDIRRKDAGYLATVLSEYASFGEAHRQATLANFDEVEECYWSLRLNRAVRPLEHAEPLPPAREAQLRARPQSTGSYLRQLFQVEKAVLELQSLPQILARTPVLVERFRIVANEKADSLKRRYDQELSNEKLERIWLAWSVLQQADAQPLPGPAPLPAGPAPLPAIPEMTPPPLELGHDAGESWLRAKLAVLLADIQWWSAQAQVREELFLGQQMQMIAWFSVFTVCGVGAYLASAGCADAGIVLAVAWFGLLGAFISIMRRMHGGTGLEVTRESSYKELTALAYGKIGIVFGMLFGAAFALVLMLVFFGGIIDSVFSEEVAHISAHFFPMFVEVPGSTLTCTSLLPVNSVEFGKLLFWSFIAGFAEKIVPDALDRLTRAASLQKK